MSYTDPPRKKPVNGYVSVELADFIAHRAKLLDFKVTKYASLILEHWYDSGAPAVHPNEYGYNKPAGESNAPRHEDEMRDADFTFEELLPEIDTVAEEQAAYTPPISTQLDYFAKQDEDRRKKALVILQALEDNEEAFQGFSKLLDAMAHLVKKNPDWGKPDSGEEPKK